MLIQTHSAYSLLQFFPETETYCVTQVRFKLQNPSAFASRLQAHISNILKPFCTG